MIYKVIIIGSGPAGLTAGIHAGRSTLEPLIIEGKNPGGQLVNARYIENWPGEKKITGIELINKIKEHAKESGCSFLSDSIIKADFSKNPFTLWTQNNNMLQARAIIIATGASHKKLNITNEDIYWGKGISNCALCNGVFYKDQNVIVIGGGDKAMENASILTKFTNKITIIQILDKLTASPILQEPILKNPNIKIIYNSTVTKIEGDKHKITAVQVTNQNTLKIQTIKTDGIFLAIGTIPNTMIFEKQLELDKKGYVILKNHTATSKNGIFAAGEVADYTYRQAITASAMGFKAAIDVDKYLKTLN